MRYKTLLLLLALAATSIALANDRGIDGVGGSWVVTGGEHAQVQMVSEEVRLEVYPILTFTRVEFVFTNHGPATTVRMGFPEHGGGDINLRYVEEKPTFLEFHSWVDSGEVQCERQLVKLDQDNEYYEAHWLKQVDFQADQTRKIRVEYVSRTGTGAGFHYAGYAFTGGNWRGKVERSHMVISIHPENFKFLPWYETSFNRRGGELGFLAKDWEAEKTIYAFFEPDHSGLLTAGWDGNTESLKGRSARELTLMRNELFALYGRGFQDHQLREYFRAQPWYREWDGYKDELVPTWIHQQAEQIMKYQNDHHLNW